MPFAKRTCSVKLDVYVGGALPRNRSRTGTIEPERWATSSVCVYVFLLVCRASMQAFKPLYYRTCRDAKPGTSHREEVTAILHAAINLCSLTLLLFYSERKGLRHVYVYAKCGDVKKRKSRHASRAKIVQAFCLSFSTYAFNCRRAQLRTELREEAWFRGYIGRTITLRIFTRGHY